jgi:hypothetical protein
LTAHTSYGQLNQDSTSLSIRNSIKCFAEQKALKVIIGSKDSINKELVSKFNRTMFLADTCIKANIILNNENKVLKDKNTTLKSYIKILGGVILVEVVRLLII